MCNTCSSLYSATSAPAISCKLIPIIFSCLCFTIHANSVVLGLYSRICDQNPSDLAKPPNDLQDGDMSTVQNCDDEVN